MQRLVLGVPQWPQHVEQGEHRTGERDGAEHLAQTGKGIDILLVDAFDRNGFAPSLANRDFFASAFAKLSGNGILVINLVGEKETYGGLIGEAPHRELLDAVLLDDAMVPLVIAGNVVEAHGATLVSSTTGSV